uniref:Uncharacterized protein n=1 Tax=Rhizophora mucronata TaxID=61149 RepID=A0A2P2NH23_RHIMU
MDDLYSLNQIFCLLLASLACLPKKGLSFMFQDKQCSHTNMYITERMLNEPNLSTYDTTSEG